MSPLQHFNYFLWYFGWFKVPLIGHLRPKIISLSDDKIVLRLRLNRRSKNHLNSMYFGALAVGADLAGGLHGFYYAKQLGVNISLAFKSFSAEFLKRPESDVYFVFDNGQQVKSMVLESKETAKRVTRENHVTAYVDYFDNPMPVAEFKLALSLKVV